MIAGFAVGGLFYTLTVSRFLPRLGVSGMMIAGATLVGVQLAVVAFGLGWKLQLLNMLLMGWGFYMIHGCLQVFASELSVEARATALSLHSFFFFMGQTVGPIAYGFGILACRQGVDLADGSRRHDHCSDLSARGCCGSGGLRTRQQGWMSNLKGYSLAELAAQLRRLCAHRISRSIMSRCTGISARAAQQTGTVFDLPTTRRPQARL